MKILLARPEHLNTVPMGRFAADALRKLGHDVVDFDLSSQWGDKVLDRISGRSDHARLNGRFRRIIDEVRPDLMLAIFGFDLTQESLDYLGSRGVVRACWWLNDPFQFNRSLVNAMHYDFLFTNSLGSVEDYRVAGISHAHWLPTACSPTVHRRVSPRSEYHCEVCFAGDWSPLRESWCETLARHFDLRIFGPWKRKLNRNSVLWSRVHDGFFSPEEMVTMFSSAEVVFNLHSWYGKWSHGTNPRLFEAAGCGVCQVVDYKIDIPLLFEVGREIITYNTQEDLIDQTRELISNSDKRRLLGENAQRRAYEMHSYDVRMHDLIERVASGR